MDAFHVALLAALTGGDPKKKPVAVVVPPPPPSGGLTGADLELAHANREFDTADKTAQQANHDAYVPGWSAVPIQRATERGQQAVGTMQQSLEDQSNLRRWLAQRLARP